ncbi:MAG: EAL domain-containing protein [Gaiellales bacterium]
MTRQPEPDLSARRRARSRQLLDLAHRQLPPTVAVNTLAAIGVTALLSDRSGDWIVAWLAVTFAVGAARLAEAYLYLRALKADPEGLAWPRWSAFYGGGLLLTGALWAVLILKSLPEQEVAGRYTAIIVVSALAAGASGMYASLGWLARVYIATLLAPPAIGLALLTPPAYTLAGLCLVFLVVMLVGHRNNREVLLHSLGLQQENADLVASLTDQNARIQDLNAGLERRVAERTEALHRLAHRDTLTGLLNRRGLLERLEEQLGDLSPEETVLYFLDLDGFKQINDGLGHDVGDDVLRIVARRFADQLQSGATIGRWGGDEFVVVAGVANAADNCAAVAEALRQSLATPIDHGGEPLHVGVSIGVAIHPVDGTTGTALIRAADLAATEVKRRGRGRVLMYDSTLSEVQRRRLELSLGLRDALAEGTLGLAYQPIVDSATGRVAALEGLLRWHHPELGSIPPDEFIPIAEESDRIVDLGEWVLRRACLDAVTWSHEGPAPRVAVNVSVRQLLADDAVETVEAALADSGLAATMLELEVTESVFNAEHKADTLEKLRHLHALGISILIDDFGSGYSSLSRLHEFPIDGIKVDRSFVSNLDGAARAVIEGAIMIARRFGLRVVAEGVETPEQAATLHRLGADALQGFYIARPHVTPHTVDVEPVWTAASQPLPVTSGIGLPGGRRGAHISLPRDPAQI